MFAFVFAYLGKQFGFSNFGKLVGISSLICGAAGLLAIPIDSLHSDAHYSSPACSGDGDGFVCWLGLGFNLPNLIQLGALVLSVRSRGGPFSLTLPLCLPLTNTTPTTV